MTDELKPCPFCGCPDVKVYARQEDDMVARVYCMNCDAHGKAFILILDGLDTEAIDIAKEAAIKAWNTRAKVDR